MVLEKNMEALKQQQDEEEVFDFDQNQRSAIIKGKRTKRPRQPSPPFLVSSAPTAAAATSSSNSTAVNYYSVSSPTTSGAEILSTTSSEDEDMAANCLILLAQGIHYQEKPEIKNFIGAVSGSDAYECKTCNRTFQSFQALGGHRASHKKPKITSQDKPTVQVTTTLKNLDHDHDRKVEDEDKEKMRIVIGNSTKVHECSICGAEFSSGQALGGHMRRHRAPPPPVVKNYSNEEEDHEKKSGNLLGLDLNLPAPIEDDNKFQFLSSNMVFSGPTLVYCHY
ncbi:zinc finger protein ZAT5 [Impatiens glandulifera]|uniref:zinc finger protein ZAT5 n=1 Tax=Impatiens glandulifera TaxID=253017 RepID=UPI001FB10B91|nr:zinc finger protein ZAT5 [Impatiens glandulifera]